MEAILSGVKLLVHAGVFSVRFKCTNLPRIASCWKRLHRVVFVAQRNKQETEAQGSKQKNAVKSVGIIMEDGQR